MMIQSSTKPAPSDVDKNDKPHMRRWQFLNSLMMLACVLYDSENLDHGLERMLEEALVPEVKRLTKVDPVDAEMAQYDVQVRCNKLPWQIHWENSRVARTHALYCDARAAIILKFFVCVGGNTGTHAQPGEALRDLRPGRARKHKNDAVSCV
jgi:hypothetical protein